VDTSVDKAQEAVKAADRRMRRSEIHVKSAIVRVKIAEHRLNVHRDLVRELHRMPDG
jgi:hypothetical protein